MADIVEALFSHRPYRPAQGIDKAPDQIKKDRGLLLDSDMVKTCLKVCNNENKFLDKAIINSR